MRTLGAIDIGTNSIKLLVAEPRGGRLARGASPREGHGAPRQRDPAHRAGCRPRRSRPGPRRSSTSSSSPAAPAPRSSARSRPAPSARPPTPSEFVEAVKKRTGVKVEVISGEEEARLINLALRSEFPARQDPLFLIDIGGGLDRVRHFGRRAGSSDGEPAARRRAPRRPARPQRPALRQGPAGHEEGDPRRRQARGRRGPQEGLQDVRRILRHDPVAVARPRGAVLGPGAEPDRPPDADPRGPQEGQQAAPPDDGEGEAAGSRARPAAARHRGPGRPAARLDPEAHGRRRDRRRRAGPARGAPPRLRGPARRDPHRSPTATCGRAASTACCGAATPRCSTRRTSPGWRSSSSTRRIPSTSSPRPSGSGSSTGRCCTTSAATSATPSTSGTPTT